MIGCGDVAEVKSGPGFYKARNSELVAVMRRNGSLAADYAKRHNVPRWHDDADAIIEAPDIDAVYIATHTDTHHAYTLRCAAAGKPVYVEKPMGLDAAQCADMISACKAHGVPLWVGFYRRALPRVLAVKDLVQRGAIGDVRMVTVRQLKRSPSKEVVASDAIAWRTDPSRGGGIFVEAACHTLDMLDFILGPIEHVRGFADNQAKAFAGEDAVVASFSFERGVYGSGAWCYSADRDEEYNEILGSKGSIRFSSFSPVPIRLTRENATEEIAIGDPPHVHQPLIQTIVDELNGQGQCPSTGETALRTALVMDAILREFRDGGRALRST